MFNIICENASKDFLEYKGVHDKKYQHQILESKKATIKILYRKNVNQNRIDVAKLLTVQNQRDQIKFIAANYCRAVQ